MADRTVELRIPAASEYVALVRTAATAVAARLDFPLDRLDDLRLAVDEAAALLLADAPGGTQLVARFTPYPDGSGLEVSVAADSLRSRGPRPGTFAWTVLTALVDEVRVDVRPHGHTVVLRAAREPAVEA